MTNINLTPLARRFRQQSTLPEKLMWDALRRQHLNGFKFRRQHPIDRFIVDFVCMKERLIIELDGVYFHDQRTEEDAARTEILEKLGYRVIRFENEYVISQFETVIAEIERHLMS